MNILGFFTLQFLLTYLAYPAFPFAPTVPSSPFSILSGGPRFSPHQLKCFLQFSALCCTKLAIYCLVLSFYGSFLALFSVLYQIMDALLPTMIPINRVPWSCLLSREEKNLHEYFPGPFLTYKSFTRTPIDLEKVTLVKLCLCREKTAFYYTNKHIPTDDDTSSSAASPSTSPRTSSSTTRTSPSLESWISTTRSQYNSRIPHVGSKRANDRHSCTTSPITPISAAPAPMLHVSVCLRLSSRCLDSTPTDHGWRSEFTSFCKCIASTTPSCEPERSKSSPHKHGPSSRPPKRSRRSKNSPIHPQTPYVNSCTSS